MTTNHAPTAERRPARAAKPYKGMAMEGLVARWYTKVTARGREFGDTARRVGERVPAGADILEVAPGPGYLAIELARAGYRVVGLDISRTFLEIARAKAGDAGVAAAFHQGNASAMPFEADRFDAVICCAAFKNFTEPVEALREMQRVLRPGGRALILDLRRDARRDAIAAHVRALGLGRVDAFMTTVAFRTFLLKNAYTAAEVRRMAAQTEFRGCEVREDAIGMEVWLTA